MHDYRHLERIIKGASNHRRIQIMDLLSAYPELSVSEIAVRLKINLKTASEHIRRLAISGLVLKRNQAKSVRHKLTDRGFAILKFLRMLEWKVEIPWIYPKSDPNSRQCEKGWKREYNNSMLVFIDDSGDPGFKFEKGSTAFFVIACVIFSDDLEAERVGVSIKELKRILKFPDEVEFKFNKSSRKTRERFLKSINGFDFKIRCLVIDKRIIKSDKLKNDKNSFYSYAIKLLLENSGGSILNAKIRIDGSGDRSFRRRFLTYLRKQLNTKQKKIMKNCKLVDSKGNTLIQMVDMIAGSIKRSCDDSKTDSLIYKLIFKKHIEDEWKFK
jgi:DNA-binding transcriptional ArsR family regulator